MRRMNTFNRNSMSCKWDHPGFFSCMAMIKSQLGIYWHTLRLGLYPSENAKYQTKCVIVIWYCYWLGTVTFIRISSNFHTYSLTSTFLHDLIEKLYNFYGVINWAMGNVTLNTTALCTYYSIYYPQPTQMVIIIHQY